MTTIGSFAAMFISAAALSMAIGVRVGAATSRLLRQAVAMPDPAIWPTSIAGWAALFLAIVACVAVFVGWGKMLGKADAVFKQLNELTSKVAAVSLSNERMQDELTIVEHTLWGPKGDNGISCDVREMVERVDAIERRNTVRDALDERERGAAEHGDERRNRHRRREDRVVLGEEEIDR
jgi:hypothetical protein